MLKKSTKFCIVFATIGFLDFGCANPKSNPDSEIEPHRLGGQQPASQLETRLIEALSKANQSSVSTFDCDQVGLAETREGYILNFNHHPGEGTETCIAAYDKAARLQNMDCNFKFVADSMGPEVLRTEIHLNRIYDQGFLRKVDGELKQFGVQKNNLVKHRVISALKDEVIGDLAKPLFKLDADLLKLLKP